MRRRDLLALAGAAAAFPSVAFAQQAAKIWRVAILTTPFAQVIYDWINEGLTQYGYVDGKSVIVERFIAPTINDLSAFAAMAVASKPDVILCPTTPATQAAKNATSTIPIVMAAVNDPVGNGLVASLARPGGNVTGTTGTAPDYAGRQLGVLKELIPGIDRLAVLSLPADPSAPAIISQIQLAAKALSIEPVIFEFAEAHDFGAQMARVAGARAQAFFRLQVAYFTSRGQQLFDFAIANRLVCMTGDPTETPFLAAVAYGPNRVELFHEAAGAYVDAILKGTRPGDLPVQQPKRFDLTINLKTARVIGLTIPPSLFAQATIIVE